MQAHKIDTVIESDGNLTLKGLPFKKGVSVEVIIIESQTESKAGNRNSLKGTVLKYEEPFAPVVPAEDWEALK